MKEIIMRRFSGGARSEPSAATAQGIGAIDRYLVTDSLEAFIRHCESTKAAEPIIWSSAGNPVLPYIKT